MRLFRIVIPNLAVSLNVALMIVIYLDMRNPMMGFLSGAPFVTLAASACICSIISAATLYGCSRKSGKQTVSAEKNFE